jgi:hypothetical protein
MHRIKRARRSGTSPAPPALRAELARVKATGKTRSGRPVGRPRRVIDAGAVEKLRRAGRSWRSIAQALKVPRRTLERRSAK